VPLELVIKADAVGSVEAVTQCVRGVAVPGVEIRLVESGLGEVTKSDVLMAATSSRLVIGFTVGIGPRVEEYAREQGVEIRLYRVIYEISRDLEEIARSLVPRPPQERITARADVIALFKSTRKGIILGCAVREGVVAVGKHFRVIDAAGPIYEGIVGSLHVGPSAVREARVGQQVGLQILDFQKARVGDLVECFEIASPVGPRPWTPQGGVQIKAS
jgi:translation initiation factor IF-2